MDESEKSLEDFFAKKSKKKGGKGKGKKFTTHDEIAKKLVEQDPSNTNRPSSGTASSVSSETSSTKKYNVTTVTKSEDQDKDADLNYRLQDDDEWTDFRDDSQKDYSGLKVQALQITDEPPEGEEEEEEVDENGEPIKSKGQGSAGPWNKPDAAAVPAAPAAAAPPPPEPEVPKEEPPAPSKGKYVPPSRRGQAGADSSSNLGLKASGLAGAAARLGAAGASGGGGGGGGVSRGMGKGRAPQLNNEFEFPSLAASSDLVKHSNKADDATFSTVTRGGQAMDAASSKGGDLQLGNRYAALGN